MIKDAYISLCGRYRYWLKRIWDRTKPQALFVMLNPSTADASVDDATIRKCIGFCERLGFGGFSVINLSAFRARDPFDLFSHLKLSPGMLDEEVSALDTMLEKAARLKWTVILAHGRKGNHRSLKGNRRKIQRLLKKYKIQPKALRINEEGVPLHPLMLPYTCKLESYQEEM